MGGRRDPVRCGRGRPSQGAARPSVLRLRLAATRTWHGSVDARGDEPSPTPEGTSAVGSGRARPVLHDQDPDGLLRKRPQHRAQTGPGDALRSRGHCGLAARPGTRRRLGRGQRLRGFPTRSRSSVPVTRPPNRARLTTTRKRGVRFRRASWVAMAPPHPLRAHAAGRTGSRPTSTRPAARTPRLAQSSQNPLAFHAYTRVPTTGARIAASPQVNPQTPWYRPRRCGGAMSATYAEPMGALRISPSVQTTTVSASAGTVLARAVSPNPTPTNAIPVPMTFRGRSRWVTLVTESSSKMTSNPFRETSPPET